MAVMSAADRNRVARIFARRVFSSNGASCHHGDLVAAVNAMDDALEATVAGLAGTAGQTLAVRLNAVWPNPFGSTATIAQRSAMFSILIGVKYGFGFDASEGG